MRTRRQNESTTAHSARRFYETQREQTFPECPASVRIPQRCSRKADLSDQRTVDLHYHFCVRDRWPWININTSPRDFRLQVGSLGWIFWYSICSTHTHTHTHLFCFMVSGVGVSGAMSRRRRVLVWIPGGCNLLSILQENCWSDYSSHAWCNSNSRNTDRWGRWVSIREDDFKGSSTCSP